MSFSQKITVAALSFAFLATAALLGMSYFKPDLFKDMAKDTLGSTLILVSTLSTGATKVLVDKNNQEK